MMQEAQLAPIRRMLFIEAAKQPGRFSMEGEHFHDAWEIYYLVSGERCYFIKDQIYRICAGDLVLIPVNVLHKTSPSGKLSQPHERLLVNFRTEAVSTLLPGREEELEQLFERYPVLRLNAEEQHLVQPLLARMLAEQKEQANGYEEYGRLLLAELLLNLLRMAHTRPNHDGEEGGGKRPYREIAEVARYINTHFEENLSLGELAGRFHLSPYYLSHVFPRVTGLTLVAYINRVRIEEACALLRETELPVTDIAYRVGYQSVTHFGRVFKKAKALSPQSYRREQRMFSGGHMALKS
ncbi:AraC family transcriptional regulator [Paenibacillus sp. MBLB2552]|uniref:AraC family transcriptional regulator n=1 Tax=Paenibacillus mellifer TaxID=2937794 RepID=A0A9X2BSF1_9BACL|nr:AraC family transcriptional regulator [Paenibacillus mellifer]MCK8486696.1 AraC family transcriptional regulator [Paenibacillus mellifer]